MFEFHLHHHHLCESVETCMLIGLYHPDMDTI